MLDYSVERRGDRWEFLHLCDNCNIKLKSEKILVSGSIMGPSGYCAKCAIKELDKAQKKINKMITELKKEL